MSEICRTGCCEACWKKDECAGCAGTGGRPFGGVCVAAECIKKRGFEAFTELKRSIIDEFNALGIENLQVEDLCLLLGQYINLEYRLANGQSLRLLADNSVYLGNQIEIPGSSRCYGIAADEKYLLVCEYGRDGRDPELILYKRRSSP